MDMGRRLRVLGRALREIIFPLVVFLLCLQVFEILMMPLVNR
jgi:hypothetical protein